MFLDKLPLLRGKPAVSAVKPAMLQASAAELDKMLSIPVARESREETERARHHERGLFLARQERWDELSAALSAADRNRATTTAGMPVADILAFGARSDAVLRVADKKEPCTDGLVQLEEALEECPDNYALGLVVAHAHMDAGWAWRGQDWTHEIPTYRRHCFNAHFARAAELLDRYDPFALDSPALAGARCALLPGQDHAATRVADDYEDLIDLDPRNPRHMRAMGAHMLPRWFGSYDALEHEAARTATRVADVWGEGGYVWSYFNALAIDARALAMVDPDRFGQGLTDILQRHRDQHTVNLLAAFTGGLMAPQAGDAELPEAVSCNRERLNGSFGLILRNALRELHPLVWADARTRFDSARQLPDRSELFEAGRVWALDTIAGQFDAQIANGTRIVFSAEGLEFEPAA